MRFLPPPPLCTLCGCCRIPLARLRKTAPVRPSAGLAAWVSQRNGLAHACRHSRRPAYAVTAPRAHQDACMAAPRVACQLCVWLCRVPRVACAAWASSTSTPRAPSGSPTPSSPLRKSATPLHAWCAVTRKFLSELETYSGDGAKPFFTFRLGCPGRQHERQRHAACAQSGRIPACSQLQPCQSPYANVKLCYTLSATLGAAPLHPARRAAPGLHRRTLGTHPTLVPD
jgi:hypothetical protein